MSAPEHRRLTLADAYRDAQQVIEQLTTRAPRVPDVDVTLTRNAKGDTQVAVKVAAPLGVDQDELTRLTDRVYLAAKATYDEACGAYPPAGNAA